MEIAAGDELGLIYGLYRLSRDILGVQPFWFWNDQPFERAAGRPVPQGWRAQSEPMAVRYRGWFINDEVLLHAWTLAGRAAGPWEMAFEALLRLGGNMVIPGTDKNAHRYGALAADFGLYVTQHHAEPLGAVMFRRAYPHLKASYAEHPDLFEGRWQAAIEAQKGWRVVWNLVSGKVRTGRARIRRARPRLRAGRSAARGRGAGTARGQRGPAGPAAGAHLRGLAAGDGQPALRHGGEVWLEAFYEAGRSRAAYLAADRAMREREHGRWQLFYANDCQADVKQSAWLMGVLMGALRNHGDGPHFYRWQRRFIDPVEDAGIMLILNMENHLDNDELFARMQAREFETGPRPE